MPLKIRCPHCFRVLIADDAVAGEAKLCPACGQVFSVPLPSQVVHAPPKPPDDKLSFPKCPHCGTELAVTATFCFQCHRDLKTGKRLSIQERLRLFSWRFWVATGTLAALGLLLVIVGVQLYRIRTRPADAPFQPTRPQRIPADELAANLLQAATPTERAAALASLAGLEQRVAPEIVTALDASLAAPTNVQTQANQLAALDLIARHASAHTAQATAWLDVLEHATEHPGLHVAALQTRALLGDERVLNELATLWLDSQQRLVLLQKLAELGQVASEPGTLLLIEQVTRQRLRCAEGLRALAQEHEARVFGPLAEAYWASWEWLGQGRGDQLADELFDLGKPVEFRLEFQPKDVRQPRDILGRIAAQGSPAARAAAGMILERRGPQYRSLSRRIAETLGQHLPEADARDQQRMTWAITRLGARIFGPVVHSHPLEVRPDEIEAALRWAAPNQPPALKPPYPQPPILPLRVVSVPRQLEQELLTRLQRGWPEFNGVLDEWLAAGLGLTPRLRRQLDPAQQAPHYATWLLAVDQAALEQAEELRPELELWREAYDQPTWVRDLAYTAVAAGDTWRARWTTNWPAGLQSDSQDAGVPDAVWRVWGHVLRAGGPALRERLASYRGTALPTELQARLLAAAERAAQEW